nr:MAG: E6 protein [Hydrurga leptonyx papillomavirus 2]
MEKCASVLELAQRLDIPLQDILLKCIFCDCFLDLFSLQHQVYANLQLVWRDHHAYGCCLQCARASGRYESARYHQGTVCSSLLGVAFLGKLVRCLLCLRQLDCSEKLSVLSDRQSVHRVRGRWRALCRVCKYDWERALLKRHCP